MKSSSLFLISLLVAGFAFCGCASGTKFVEIGNAMPAVTPHTGRIYIYRTAMVPLEPDIKVDGRVVGTAKLQGFLFVDLPAGPHKISSSTEVTRALTVAVEAGQARYVRLGAAKGFLVVRIYPELVDPAVGVREMKECSYTGSALSK